MAAMKRMSLFDHLALIQALVPKRCFHSSALLMRYKKKWVEMGRKKVEPRELALAYFDTYYPKLYGEACWEEMRFALLRRKKKYCALVNNFAHSHTTVNELLSEHHAFDMLTLTGPRIKVTSCKESESAVDYETDELSAAEQQIDESRSTIVDLKSNNVSPTDTEYIETPEGFMIPKPSEVDTPLHNYPPDLYDYIPAERIVTEKELEQSEIDKQTFLLEDKPLVEIVPSEALLVPPMLKCHVHEAGVVKEFPSPKQDETKLLTYYLMDAASVLPVIALDVRPNDRVLDLCAGPGGKSLVIAQTLLADKIVCVDSSRSRLNRVRDIMTWYVPGALEQSDSNELITLLSMDGRKLGDVHPNRYDKVLVDVPCNTDRIVVHANENNRFKRTRVTERLQLPQIQTELLMSGIRACRPGGTVVYSTCTLTPGQNDYVIESAISRLNESQKNIEVVVQDTSAIRKRLDHIFKFWPNSRYGQIVLPCTEANFGPAYFAKLIRVR